jgi:cbb3-type cytochrome oxidase subunit 3
MCLSAAEGTREAYYGTTALMMALPFLLIGAIAWWLRRAARSANREAARVPPRERPETDRGLAFHTAPPHPPDA